jgi:hypothetical protein
VKSQLIIPLLQGKFSSPETMQKKPSKKGGENLISPVGFRLTSWFPAVSSEDSPIDQPNESTLW